MTGFGEAVAYGAATIINAIATGKGAAIGVNLWTRAKVQLSTDAGIVRGRIIAEPDEDTTLIREAVLGVLQYFHVDKEFGAEAQTESNIPIARGLKSSSVAANALILATIAALRKKLSYLAIIALGVDAALRAKTTITGAFDDGCASFFGNIVVTDNLQRNILKKFIVKDDLSVVFHIPNKKSYTYTSNVSRMKLIAPQVEIAFQEVLSGNYWTALTLNGILYSAALGYDQNIALDALEVGALAAGLSGKGPATVAIVAEDGVGNVVNVWRSYGGRIITAKINKEKARITRRE